jgi:hypothetical protein
MFDDLDSRPQPTHTHPHREAQAEQERAWTPMPAAADATDRRPLRGDPTRLITAAAVLRAGDAERIFGTRFPGEYIMIGLARLLEALAYKMQEHVDLGHGVVSAASEIAEHALAYVPRDDAQP